MEFSRMVTITLYAAAAAAAAASLQLCPTLCDPIDSSPPGSRIPGILQARTLEWVAISFSSGRKWKVKVKSLSCVWLCDPMDRSLPGSSVHGIFQAKVCIDSCFSLNLGSPWPLFLQILFLSLSLLGLPHNEIVNDVSQVPLVLKIFFSFCSTDGIISVVISSSLLIFSLPVPVCS